jgi:hypothetical protein
MFVIESGGEAYCTRGLLGAVKHRKLAVEQDRVYHWEIKWLNDSEEEASWVEGN